MMFKTRIHAALSVALVAGLSAGCQLIVDFNRGLIDAGDLDATFDDAGEGGVDGGVDALPTADAVSDVVVRDSTVDAAKDGGIDAALDGKADATLDGKADGPSPEAGAETGALDAHDGAATDAHDGSAPKDGATKPDGASDAADAG